MATDPEGQNEGRQQVLHEARLKAEHFCAYQERTQQQVRDKLYKLGLYSGEVEQVLSDLITAGFINEVRFAKQFAGGKFRLKKWGRNKIINEMKARGLSQACITEGLKEIDGEDYLVILEELAEKKYHSLSGDDDFIKRQKTFRYLLGKGYEPEMIANILDGL